MNDYFDLLYSLVKRGAAVTVVCDENNNSKESIEKGYLNIDLYATFPPGSIEFVKVPPLEKDGLDG
jgi:hypothetical protein